MTDKPIIFSAAMVRALLDGRKTQTRRVVKIQPGELDNVFYCGGGFWHVTDSRGTHMSELRVPYAIGDRLYVREAFKVGNDLAPDLDLPTMWIYRATAGDPTGPWRSPIHMPRRASRLTLTVTDVRVQRLQEISEADAKAEGLEWVSPTYGVKGLANSWSGDPRHAFSTLWDSVHVPDAWDANPWVVAITFDVQRWNIDTMVGAARK